MAKNIVLCSDGTGNRGGKGQNTNVWRIYHAIDHNCRDKDQITFYDDGVGTEDNKYRRLLGGAFGIGMSRNVRDLYRFLNLNYDDGTENQDGEADHIYLFGFSRGAYTVRALAAFVACCGVIKDARDLSEQELKTKTDTLVDAYKSRETDVTEIEVAGVDVTRPVIKCIGVWDTVSAVGVPFDIGLKKLLLRLFSPFRFRDLKLNTRVRNAFHALSVDDQRLTFHPEIWENRNNIDQVWFSGVHSNVGGGYPKQGMSYVALDWMMERVAFDSSRQWGLHFEPSLREEARHHANVNDKLYDSRAGAAAYYRYAPRDIEALMAMRNGSQSDLIRVHESVLERIEKKTLGYNPGNLPSRNITVVTTAGPDDSARMDRVNNDNHQQKRKNDKEVAESLIAKQKALHLAFVFVSLFIAAAAGQQAIRPLGLPSWGLFILPGILTLVACVTLKEIHETHSRAVSILALAATALFWIPVLSEFVPMFKELTATRIFGGPVEVWSWVDKVLEFLLPDQLAALIVDLVAVIPLATVAVMIALLLMLVLRSSYRNKLAVIHENVGDTMR
jgi:type VI secretion system (T6SS) phospholipase Tle1-like effector